MRIDFDKEMINKMFSEFAAAGINADSNADINDDGYVYYSGNPYSEESISDAILKKMMEE